MRFLSDTDEHIHQAAAIILSGGVVAHATETCYGLACDLSNVAAVEKLFRIKNRPFSQPVSALFATVEEAKKYVEWNPVAEELAKEGLPGPVTLVLMRRGEDVEEKRRRGGSGIWDQEFGIRNDFSQIPNPKSQIPSHNIYIIPTTDLSKQQTIGLRVSPHPVASRLCQLVGRPISTTSANVHGQPNPYSAEEIAVQYQDRELQPDLVLNSGALPWRASSEVILVENGKNTKIR